MKNFIIRAFSESLIFSLCFTGITALLNYFFNRLLSNSEILLSILFSFIGWFVWIIIDTKLLKKR